MCFFNVSCCYCAAQMLPKCTKSAHVQGTRWNDLPNQKYQMELAPKLKVPDDPVQYLIQGWICECMFTRIEIM